MGTTSRDAPKSDPHRPRNGGARVELPGGSQGTGDIIWCLVAKPGRRYVNTQAVNQSENYKTFSKYTFRE